MSFNATQTASDLRIEAARLKEQASRLLKAADVLDPRNITEPPLNFEQGSVPLATVIARSRTKLSQGEAARVVLEKAGGAMDREDIFSEVKLRGVRGESLASFCSVLSREKKIFVSVGKGKWDLRARANGITQARAA